MRLPMSARRFIKCIAFGTFGDGFRFIGPFTPEHLAGFLAEPRHAWINDRVSPEFIITMNDPEEFGR